MNDKLSQIEKLLASCTSSQRKSIFQMLRKEFPIHPIEVELNTEAERAFEKG